MGKTVTNGDKIVLDKLDTCVSTTGDDQNQEDWAVVFDHSCLVKGCNVSVIKDLLDLPERISGKVLSHPVIRTFIESRWQKTRFTFVFSFLLYLSFVLLFSSFIWLMYQRDGFDVNTIKVMLPERCDKLKPITMAQSGSPGKDWTDLHRAPTLEYDPEYDPEGIDVTLGAQHLSLRQTRSPKSPTEDTYRREPEYVLSLEVKKTRTKVRSRANQHLVLFGSCESSDWGDISLCTVEVLLFASIIWLISQELWQMVALGRVYFREMENWFELIIISFAIATLAFKDQTDVESLKIVSAIGICFAWIQLIFLLGRYPFLGGNFSIMYYSITKRVIKTVFGFFILICAFTFGFFIIHFNHETESFDELGKSFIKVLVMILGEFEFDDLWTMSGGAGTTNQSRLFTMVLLVLLIMFGSVTMVNLIIAIIITDVEWLKKESRNQILLNQAQHAVRVHTAFTIVSSICKIRAEKIPLHWVKGSKVRKLELCVHSLCQCGKTRPDKEVRRALMDILGLED